MRHCISLFVILCLSFPALCQTATRPSATVPGKPPIDSAAIAGWADLLWSEPSISPDGKYFMYPIENLPIGSKTLVVQSTQGTWKKEFVGANPGIFSFDSKYAIFQSADSLFFLSLTNKKMECVSGVSSYASYPKKSSGKLIAYKLKHGNVVLKDLVKGKEFDVDNVSDFLLNASGSAMVVKRVNKQSAGEELDWLDLSGKQLKHIWSNKDSKSSIRSYQFDQAGGQVVFLTQNKGDVRSNTIWYYKLGMQGAEIKVSNELLKRNDSMLISSSAPSFSKTGNFIFFTLQHEPEPLPQADPKAVQLDVWNYKDLVLQSLQAYYKNTNDAAPQDFIKSEFLSAIAIVNGQIIQLENDSERIAGNYGGVNDFVITVSYKNNGDKKWLKWKKDTYSLTFLNDGRKKHLITSIIINEFWLSPNNKFLVYFDPGLLQYMSYNISNGTTKNISKTISVKLTRDKTDELISPNTLSVGLAGWLDNGNLLTYDNYDIWMLDPSGEQKPRNITNGFGRSHNIKFDLIPEKGLSGENIIWASSKPLLFTGFWVDTKQNGFFRLDINKSIDPELLSVHSALIYASSKQMDGAVSLTKAKADHADVWIMRKQTMTDAPNFYLTSDFKNFRRLTNIQPQKNYRWATSELITWKMPDGKPCHGILYKPEDFDAGKRYPVIVYYYEKVSGGLHEFFRPDLMSAGLNIPWFVSRGYLVFTPDIHYTINKVSQSVVNSVVPGVRELLKLSFVDSSAIGIQGHSFGGYETNVLITETSLFAAAAEGAGASDLISQYGSLLPTGRNDGQGSRHQELGGQHRMNTLLWGDKNAYIENSPIFKADKVTTPLLIMHNKGDEAVPWGQAVELFIALRRLDKPVWMLQYDKGGHGVGGKDEMDYTIRMTQFFDHFLKGDAAPKWMTRGIPATLKGIVTGYELDPLGSCSKDCKSCKNGTNNVQDPQ